MKETINPAAMLAKMKAEKLRSEGKLKDHMEKMRKAKADKKKSAGSPTNTPEEAKTTIGASESEEIDTDEFEK